MFILINPFFVENPSASSSKVAMSVMAAKDALEKAKKAEQVQKQIQEHLKKINLTKKLLPTTANLGIRPLLLDSLGQVLDESGNVLKQKPIIHSTLKINRNLTLEKQKKEVVEKSAKIAEKAERTQYMDPTLNTIKKRKRAAFNFVEPGTYIKQERQLQRQQEQKAYGLNKNNLAMQKKLVLEQQDQRSNARLKLSIAEEKGISVGEVTEDLSSINPNLIPIKKGLKLEKKDSWDDEEPSLEWWDRGVILLKNGEDPFKTANAKKHQFLVNIDPEECVINDKKFTTYIEHPCKLDGKKKKPNQIPEIILTKKERKRLRRLKRQERLKKIQDKIRIGILPPPPPKLKLSNLMRVLKDQSVADPSKVEKQVREQMEERLRNHEKRNEERKLTPEQRSKKHAKKWQLGKHEDIEAALFTLKSLANPRLLFKVDKNAQQFHLTGCCVLVNNGPAFVVVEGSKLSIKRYTKLLMRRIKWDDYELQSDIVNLQKTDDNFCKHVWVGSVKKRNFPHWSVYPVECDEEIVELLKQFKALHYFEMVQKYRDPLDDI
ncbi:pre-mRNA processing factor 3 PRP3 domain-containing protein [Theileria equi strain WA]|uniref:Pre-mRNA processing factor 3 PRP3 domain-containing protein n=1 Tax=Theileria equi strain WA TaxID=1537102 RepID=L0B260_THEEQ|nr:pre-mRNA processing factor 3 PRP3 domain-containing protein [Theileria equi strain WA]AFZ81219.1 pre-mRNA processing factor 3 PRP3 domain-containing protein [Theileria equi strain WA]|eukprot:XP_004830885.1 pre-mRNA processing factor 3 PRP3 domain-containing protein [Theileria equi strain WA]